MRYLKLFRESTGMTDVEELIDFCETYLAYLIDEGFKVKVYIKTDNYCVLRIFKIKSYADNVNRAYDTTYKFSWNSVKDYFIPFFKILDKKYELYLQPHNNIRKDDLHKLKDNKVIFYKSNGEKVFGNNNNILNDIFSKNFKKTGLDSIEFCVKLK